MSIVTAISVLALLFSLVGNALINFQKRTGYILWIISNVFWITVNFIDHMNVSQVIMYIVYTAFNVWGFIMWSKRGDNDA